MGWHIRVCVGGSQGMCLETGAWGAWLGSHSSVLEQSEGILMCNAQPCGIYNIMPSLCKNTLVVVVVPQCILCIPATL